MTLTVWPWDNVLNDNNRQNYPHTPTVISNSLRGNTHAIWPANYVAVLPEYGHKDITYIGVGWDNRLYTGETVWGYIGLLPESSKLKQHGARVSDTKQYPLQSFPIMGPSDTVCRNNCWLIIQITSTLGQGDAD